MKIQKSGTPNPIRTAPTSVNAVDPVPIRTLLIAVNTAVICDFPLGSGLEPRLARGFRREMPQISLGVDPPSIADLGQARRHRPAIGALLAGVVRGRALERHAAGVVSDRADLGDLLGAQPPLHREGRELGPLLLDRPGPLPHLLDEGWHHAFD